MTQENYTLGCTTELNTICKEVPLKKIRIVGHVIVVTGYLLSPLFVKYTSRKRFSTDVSVNTQFFVVFCSKIVTILFHRVT